MIASLFNRRVATVAALGFSSGLPLALSAGTLQAWLTVQGVEVSRIGVFSLVGLPYVLKFLWAPLLDRYQPGWPGRRRDWMVLAQLLLAALLFMAGAGNLAAGALPTLALAAVAIAFLSATQDVAIDAYRTELLHERERGFGAGVAVTGYRIGMLLASAGALLLADVMGFAKVYEFMGLCMLIGAAASLAGPPVPEVAAAPGNLVAAMREPLTEYFRRDSAVALLVLIFLYKLGDAFAGGLTTNFLLGELGFTLTDVGTIYKGLGLVASVGGALYGGAMMLRLGLYRALVLFAWLQALTNLGFALLAMLGKSYGAMVAVVALENLAGGMGTAAYLALLMSICDRRYTATQFALLSAVASLGRVFAGPPAGYLVEALGWPAFFITTFVLALPALVILKRQRHLLERLDAKQDPP
jgi:PAT family beta-lactamase induction signal transducer AmpG